MPLILTTPILLSFSYLWPKHLTLFNFCGSSDTSIRSTAYFTHFYISFAIFISNCVNVHWRAWFLGLQIDTSLLFITCILPFLFLFLSLFLCLLLFHHLSSVVSPVAVHLLSSCCDIFYLTLYWFISPRHCYDFSFHLNHMISTPDYVPHTFNKISYKFLLISVSLLVSFSFVLFKPILFIILICFLS